jgi:hypothetical protein
MRVSFLFWNVRRATGSALLASVFRLAAKGIQVFLFAEGPSDPANLLAALNRSNAGLYNPVASKSRRVLFFSCLPNAQWTDRFYDEISDRLSVQELQAGSSPGILIVGAHLDSPNNLSLEGRAEWARDVAADIRKLEGDVGHNRTLLVGDLNMEPFDGGLVETSALHAMMTWELTHSVQQLKARREFLPFYNPMWSCFGDRPHRVSNPGTAARRPPGTYFWNQTNDRANRFWSMYDQVLLRPNLMDRLVHLEILDTDGEQSLVTDEGRPRSDALTDHLPILFELDL